MTVYDFFPDDRRRWFLKREEGRSKVVSTEVVEIGINDLNMMDIRAADDPTQPWHLRFPVNTVLVVKEQEA